MYTHSSAQLGQQGGDYLVVDDFAVSEVLKTLEVFDNRLLQSPVIGRRYHNLGRQDRRD